MMADCFVIQPFDRGEYDKRFADIYKPALEKAGFDTYRVDQDPSVEIPISAIEKRISEATICLADISTNNPNVWYELGFAFAVDRPVIMICSKGRDGKFPFDIQHRSIIEYSSDSMSDFKKLEQQIFEKASALLEQCSRPRQVGEQKKDVPKEDLSLQELQVLDILAEDAPMPKNVTSSYFLQAEAKKSGLMSASFGLAVRRLTKKQFVETLEVLDERDGEPYPGMRLTELAWDWIDRNEGRLLLYKREKSIPKRLDDDIPF